VIALMNLAFRIGVHLILRTPSKLLWARQTPAAHTFPLKSR
jgi:hypothetical protein